MYIYKITNDINNKVYIGQTVKKPEERWKEHQSRYDKNYPAAAKKPLYLAMKKYGIEHFHFEVIQGNINTQEELDAAEIYWIHYYNSYIKGYNATFGGQGSRQIFPIQEIIEEYLAVRSMNKVHKKFNISVDTISEILKAANVPIYSFRQSAGKRIKISKENFFKEFDSVKDCAEWFIEQQIPKTKSVESVRTSLKIKRRDNENPYYYGYLIENIEE